MKKVNKAPNLLILFPVVVICLALAGCATVELSQHELDKIKNRVIAVKKQQTWNEIIKLLKNDGFSLVTEDFQKGLIVTHWKVVDKMVGKAFIAPYTEVPDYQIMITLQVTQVDSTFTKIRADMKARTLADGPENRLPAELHLKYYDKWFAKLGRKIGVRIPHQGPETWYRTSK